MENRNPCSENEPSSFVFVLLGVLIEGKTLKSFSLAMGSQIHFCPDRHFRSGLECKCPRSIAGTYVVSIGFYILWRLGRLHTK